MIHLLNTADSSSKMGSPTLKCLVPWSGLKRDQELTVSVDNFTGVKLQSRGGKTLRQNAQREHEGLRGFVFVLILLMEHGSYCMYYVCMFMGKKKN